MAQETTGIGRDGTAVAFINVIERERALAFYQDVLGAAHRSTDMFGDFLTLQGALLRLTALPDYKPAPHPVLGWQVEDIVGAAEALAARGLLLTRFEGLDQDALGIWTSPENGSKVGFFADPDGNVLSLMQL
jgi:catechol 2,3-dioxygenase-like lactoylglutathione lyase family enzyme